MGVTARSLGVVVRPDPLARAQRAEGRKALWQVKRKWTT